MRPALFRIAAIVGVVAAVAGCDSRGAPTTFGAGGTSQTGTKNALAPTVVIDSPTVGTLVNIGDSILVELRLHDPVALTNAQIVGYTVSGSIGLGTYTRKVRFPAIPIPVAGSFRAALRDTIVRRYLKPAVPVDSTVDSLIVFATVTNSAGLTDSTSVRVNIVSGPTVVILTPTPGDSVPAGVALTVTAQATQPTGVGRVSIRVQGDVNWPTPLDTTISQSYSGNARSVTFTVTVPIPANAVGRSKITVNASAVDLNRNPGSAPTVVLYVQSAGSVFPPRVTQVVPPRIEATDSVLVNAVGAGIRFVGLVIRDSVGAVIVRDSIELPTPYSSNVQRNVPVNLTTAQQGERLSVTSFAIDQAGRIGYSVPQGTGVPVTTLAAAHSDSTLLVYGRTYPLPRNGVIADLAVEPTRGNVFLSNSLYNLIEVWQNGTKQFSPSGIAVGSLPWGLFVGNNPDTLLVANSGATTISRVFIGSTNPAVLQENLAQRIRTRESYVFNIVITRDPSTGVIHITATGPFSYSDRPQYIAESKAGRIFYSTRPTATAPQGTARWLDPTLPVPDPRQIWQYGNVTLSATIQYALFNVDSIAVLAAPPGSTTISDSLFIWDHPYGQAAGVLMAKDADPVVAVSNIVAQGSDAELVRGLDISSLGLTDTTFTAASGDRTWIGFGQGNTPGSPGRIFMINDPAGTSPPFFSPVVTVQDLMNNASEQVFGLAIDSVGRQVGAHGLSSYFASIDNPFHLRLEGTYASFSNGAGIAFAPGAQGPLTANASRIAYVASTTGAIEVVDVAYFINRATLLTKNSLYGPLRATGPLPGDPPGVVAKLYGLTTNGLVVIDLTAADVRAGPLP